MFRNNKINMVTSIAIAIFLWMYVVGQVNPTTVEKISNVPLKFVGEEVLDENGLAMIISEDTNVTVTIKGNRADLKKIKAEDLGVAVDVSQLVKGENKVSIMTTPPKKAEVVKVFPEAITIMVDERVVESRRVEAEFIGDMGAGSEPGDIKIKPDTVEISGAKGIIKKVDKVIVPVAVTDIKHKDTTMRIQGQAVDAKGNPVKHVRIHGGHIAVTASILGVKTVSLQAETTGKISSIYELENIEIPKQVVIKGSKDILNQVSKIVAVPVDISQITKTTSLPLELKLPEGVELAKESLGLAIRVVLKNSTTTTIEYGAASVEVRNLKKGLKAKVNSGKIIVTVKGKETILKAINQDDITLYADGSEAVVGTQNLKIQGAYTKEFLGVSFTPGEVEVVISEE